MNFLQVLFMKGSPEAPQCGFSRQVANVLRMNNVEKYTYVDILKNQSVRRVLAHNFGGWYLFFPAEGVVDNSGCR